jgi:hypothetical protein
VKRRAPGVVTLGGVMMPYRRSGSAARRFADGGAREDGAPELCRQVPALASLEPEEQCGVGGIKHFRRFVIERAPAPG